MLIRNLLLKYTNLSKLYALHGYKNNVATRQAFTSSLDSPILTKEFATAPTAQKPNTSKQISTMMGLKEFFTHPLTWDRNNGYINILLGLAIFGYCFCTACQIDKTKSINYEADNKK